MLDTQKTDSRLTLEKCRAQHTATLTTKQTLNASVGKRDNENFKGHKNHTLPEVTAFPDTTQFNPKVPGVF